MDLKTFVALATLVLASDVDASVADAEIIADANATASLLAGNDAPDAKSITRGKTWKAHKTAMGRAWSSYQKATLDPMGKWSRKEVAPHLPKGGVVRYPFSGPDVLHVLRMFPDAESYILCGLEPVGSVPRSDILRGRGSATALAEIRKILEESIRYSFFKTKDMRVELANSRYGGTLPIMCLFLARSGFEITAVEFLKLGGNGELSRLGFDQTNASAVRIDAKSKRGHTKSIYYFRTNIADDSISKSGFLAFMESLPPGGSYVKSASYLMHKSYFSRIRNHLLASSTVLVQDDSGIPIRHFDRSQWQLAFHGSYSAPIPLFSAQYQADLRKAYRTGAKPLPFGTGYRWRKGDSNLLCAVSSHSSPAPRAIARVPKAIPLEPKPQNTPPVSPSAPAAGDVVSFESTLDLTLKLVATSDLDAPRALGRRSAFVVNEYEILAVNTGPQSCRGKRIRIANTTLLNGRPLPARPLGAEISLRVKPLSTYPGLMRWHLEDDLPQLKNAVLYIAALR